MIQTFETSGYSLYTVADVRLLNSFNATGINTEAAQLLQMQHATTTLGTNVSSYCNRNSN